MPRSAEEQEPRATEGQCLKLSAIMVEHNHLFRVMSKKAIEFWSREPGAATIYAARHLEEQYQKMKHGAPPCSGCGGRMESRGDYWGCPKCGAIRDL